MFARPWRSSFAFPADGQSIEGAKFGQVASYVSDSAQGYAGENERLFDPMAKSFDLLRRLGTVFSSRGSFRLARRIFSFRV